MFSLKRKIQVIVSISFLTALTAIGAFIKIPFPVVPITLQTLFVLLAGNLLGSRYGAVSQIVYLTLGLAGLPIFANGGGVGYIMQPTFGYLMGYPLCAFVSGKLTNHYRGTEGRNRIVNIFLSNMIALFPIFIFGVSYLYFNFNIIIGKELSFARACWAGCVIFLPGDLLKALCAAVIANRLQKFYR